LSEVGTNQSVLKDELYKQYNWFYESFVPTVQNAGDEFFSKVFSFSLISLSKNVNVLFKGDDYFVTKIRLDKQHDVFFRCSAGAVQIILDKVLGENKRFDLSRISELEAKIISSFNDYVYGSISKFLLPTPSVSQKRKDFDIIHLTFLIRDNTSGEGAKVIISLPSVLLAPEIVELGVGAFDVSDFKASKLDVKIKAGTTRFFIRDLKSLEKGDIVVFDESDIHVMKLFLGTEEREFRINPNPGLITTGNNNGGHNMSEKPLSQDLWDNIQVEMSAEFEKVKITLGELKNIEQGLVVDISSLYDNKISLRVENKTIAKGELVIINDRYGVRIDEVFASDSALPGIVLDSSDPFTDEAALPEAAAEQTADGEFDYSDFELDDQDI